MTGCMLNVYATRTQISIRGILDQNTLIEQSPKYSNRRFSRKYKSLLCNKLSPPAGVSMVKMKCIGNKP